jgi:hypothetical protein
MYSYYIRSNKDFERKADFLMRLQREMIDLEKRFSFKLLTKKTKENLNKILNDNFKMILFDVDEFTSNLDKIEYKRKIKNELERLRSKTPIQYFHRDIYEKEDIFSEANKKIDDYIKTL